MRLMIIATAFLLFGLTEAIAQPGLPPGALEALKQNSAYHGTLRTVDLDAPGALEVLKQTNPAHYATVRTILAEVFLRPDAEVPRWLQASFNARGGYHGPIVFTSQPPKRRLSFTLDDTSYVAVITLTNVPGAVVPLK